jgi:phosphoribosylformylglycinamidine (FGAM) synthase PurS component
MEFNPPIENRETDELIVISKSSTDDYQAKAIELAKKELDKRKIAQTDIDKRYNELFAEHEKVVEQIMTEIAAEDYSVFEKIWIVVFWPRELFHGWYLRRDGYTLKASNRIKLILIGVGLYALIILFS